MITLESRINPRTGDPWLCAFSNPFFDIVAKTAVQNRLRAAGVGGGYALGNRASRTFRRPDGGDGTMIPLDDHFQSFLDLRKDSIGVARKFQLR